MVPVALRQGGAGGDGADYINCALDRDGYEAFIDALLAGEKTDFKEWETNALFRGLLPIEADGIGRETLRFGPMEANFTFTDHTDHGGPWAVVSSRRGQCRPARCSASSASRRS